MAGVIVMAVSTGCVKIQTGQTVEEATESNEFKARQIRSEWALQLNSATPLRTAELVKMHIDSVSAMYLRYGFKVADEWHKGNEGRGKVVDAGEMRQVVDAWVFTQKPILNAYEDNLEFGLTRVKESRFFQAETLALLERMAEQFYANRSIVFYPNQDVEYYESRLIEAQKATESLSRELGLEIGKY
jgi:hypothetical protein